MFLYIFTSNVPSIKYCFNQKEQTLVRIFLIYTIFIFSSCKIPKKSFNDTLLFGIWESKNKTRFEFHKDYQCVFFLPHENSPQTLKGVFSLNILKDLKTINIKKIDGLSYSLYGIFDFIDDKTLKISKFSHSPKTRSISFENNNYLILYKKKIHGST